MDITKLSMTELKALAYDMIAQRDNTSQQLQVVNNEIANRQAEASAQEQQAILEKKAAKKKAE